MLISVSTSHVIAATVLHYRRTLFQRPRLAALGHCNVDLGLLTLNKHLKCNLFRCNGKLNCLLTNSYWAY